MTKEEYQRFRKIALKRIARLEKAGLSKRLLKNYGMGASFPNYTQLKGNAKEFTRAATQVQQFLKAKTSTVKGAKAANKKTKDMLKKAGLSKTVKLKDIENFGAFMKAAREAAGDEAFDSDRAATSYAKAVDNKIDWQLIADNFDKWLAKNLDTKVDKRGWQVSNKQIDEMFNNTGKGGKNERNKGRSVKPGNDRQNGRRVNGRASSGAQKKKK